MVFEKSSCSASGMGIYGRARFTEMTNVQPRFFSMFFFLGVAFRLLVSNVFGSFSARRGDETTAQASAASAQASAR